MNVMAGSDVSSGGATTTAGCRCIGSFETEKGILYRGHCFSSSELLNL